MERHILPSGGYYLREGLAAGVLWGKPLCVLESSFIRSSDTISFCAAESVNNTLLLARYLPLHIDLGSEGDVSRKRTIAPRTTLVLDCLTSGNNGTSSRAEKGDLREMQQTVEALYWQEITQWSYPGYDKNANRNLSSVSRLSGMKKLIDGPK
jgi:hypothetical protein